MEISNCCSAPVYDETDICMECKEHCEVIKECEACGGYHEEENECEATNGKMD